MPLSAQLSRKLLTANASVAAERMPIRFKCQNFFIAHAPDVDHVLRLLDLKILNSHAEFPPTNWAVVALGIFEFHDRSRSQIQKKRVMKRRIGPGLKIRQNFLRLQRSYRRRHGPGDTEVVAVPQEVITWGLRGKTAQASLAFEGADLTFMAEDTRTHERKSLLEA